MIYICPGCGRKFSSERPGVVICPSCGAKSSVPPLLSAGTPWDLAGKGSFVGSFFETVKLSIVDPVRFFGAVGRGRDLFRAWLFALIVSSVVFIFAAAYQAGFQALAAGMTFAGELGKAFTPLAFLTIPLSLGALVGLSVVAVPLFTTLAVFAQSGIYHLCLMLTGEGRGGFWKTFRVVCYSNGPQLFQAIPMLGGLVAPVWQLVLAVIGIKVVHETSYGKSLLAVFLPSILCCGVAMLALVAILGGAFGAALMG